MRYDNAKFKRALMVKGWSQKTLAQKSGLKQPTVCDFLNGKSQSPETAKVLAAKLGLRMEDIVTDESEVAQ